ncbi:MAG: iron-sulfur cluster assembly scaffold protein [Patescibacteria group bacterium]
MAYSEKVIDHYENPRNVGSLDKSDPDVGTGLVGAPACGDVMKLQIRTERKIVGIRCLQCETVTPAPKPDEFPEGNSCGHLGYAVLRDDVIVDAKFKTFGCGSAIASSSLVTEWIKGKAPDEAAAITNKQIAAELSLPPVKIHCSVLAEDAVKAAILDWRTKQAKKLPAEKTALAPLPSEHPAPPSTDGSDGC